jgi:hypothetical protein
MQNWNHSFAKIGQNRLGLRAALRMSNLRCCISSACRSTINCWIAKVCFRLELRANLWFQISTTGACRAKQTYGECTQFTANLCFQACKPLGEVTRRLLAVTGALCFQTISAGKNFDEGEQLDPCWTTGRMWRKRLMTLLRSTRCRSAEMLDQRLICNLHSLPSYASF